MRAHKRNPYWSQGLDRRQARRKRRRLRQKQAWHPVYYTDGDPMGYSMGYRHRGRLQDCPLPECRLDLG